MIQRDIPNTEMDANVLKEQRTKEVREAEIQILIATEQKNIELAGRKAERREAELLETAGRRSRRPSWRRKRRRLGQSFGRRPRRWRRRLRRWPR